MYKGEMDKAETYFKQSITLRKKYSKNDKIISAYNNLANLYRKKGQLEKADSVYLDALKLLDDNNSIIRAKILSSQGDILQQQAKLEEAIELLEESIRINQLNNNENGLADAWLILGQVYHQQFDWDKTEKMYLASLELFKKMNSFEGMARCYLNLGAAHFDYYESIEAQKYYENVLELKEYISAKDLAKLFNNLGNIYNEKELFNQAENHYLKGLEIFEKLQDTSNIALVNYNLGKISTNKEDYTQGIVFLKKAHKLLNADRNPYLKTQILYLLSDTYRKLKNEELALDYLYEYDILRNKLNNKYFDAFKYQRNQEESQKEIAQLKHQASETRRQNQLYMGLGLLFFITLLGGIAAFVAYRNRQQQLIAEYQADKAFMEKEQAYSKIDDLLITQELNMANAKLAAKDETELRIAKDLHDRLGAMLSTIKLYFNDVNDQLKTVKLDISPQHQKANELLDDACAEVRLIAHNMASGTLSKFGLIKGLNELTNTINESNQIKAKLYTHGLKERLDFETERKVYKIILELVGNALKHAKAEKLNIQLNQIEEELNIVIEDDGKGFKPEEIEQKSSGMGLRNITLRVADLNGRFHIDSGKGNGTTVAIDIPIQVDNKKI